MSTFSIKSIGFAITAAAVVETRSVPQRHAIVNRFDEHGDLFSLDRLPYETNPDFKKRIIDLSVHPGGPNYEGLANNLARELGAPRKLALTIDLIRGSDGSPLAPGPRVDILADRMILYSSWRDYDDYVVDKEINIYDLGCDGYSLNGLVQEINTSEYFMAAMSARIRPNLHSATLIRGTSYNKISDDIVAVDQQTVLTKQNLLPGTAWFSDKIVFSTEVFDHEPESNGEYYIDYSRGLVRSYAVSTGDAVCGYAYCEFPYKVDCSLVHIYSLGDQNYLDKLFHKEELPSGEEINALPNTEGAEVLHQVFKKAPVFWGK